MDLCEAVEKKRGEWIGMRWWEQAGIDLARARETATVAVAEDGIED